MKEKDFQNLKNLPKGLENKFFRNQWELNQVKREIAQIVKALVKVQTEG